MEKETKNCISCARYPKNNAAFPNVWVCLPERNGFCPYNSYERVQPCPHCGK